MAYTPFKMKGPSLYSSATKMADKPKDINKNGKIDGFEQARFDAIKANSPGNYGTMKSPAKVQEYKDKIQLKKEKEKAAFEEKKKAAIRQGKIANWNKKNPKASQEEMNKFISSLK
tara:strand:+ start:744 stop:1091 length:348 start_codon:yes stop_codon:yes gene_type:complete